MRTDPPTWDRSLGELVDRIGRLLHYSQFVSGLNPAQWQALRFVARANRYSRTPGGVADFLGTTKGTASQTLIALEEKGLVRRLRGASDRRQVIVEVTDAGRAQLSEDPVNRLYEALGSLSAVNSGALKSGLDELLCKLQGSEAGACTFGVCDQCSHFSVEGATSYCCQLTGDTIAPADRELLCVSYLATGSGSKADPD